MEAGWVAEILETVRAAVAKRVGMQEVDAAETPAAAERAAAAVEPE